MKSVKGKVITLLVVIGILIIGIGVAILLSNNKDMVQLSNQVAKVEEFKSNIDMTNVMSYYVDVSDYTVNNEKKAKIRYEYTDTTGNDKYDTCQITITAVTYFTEVDESELRDKGWNPLWEGPMQPIKSISKTYRGEIDETIEITGIGSINIDTGRIGEEVIAYDWSDNISNSYVYGTVSYRYADTIGNGKWNTCIVTVAFQDGWHFSNDNWETDEEANQYYKIFRENIENDQYYVFLQGSSGMLTISVDKIGENITELSMDNNKTMIEGRSYQLNVEQQSLSTNSKTLRWTSLNENIAVVNQYGVVTAKNVGTATIKVEAMINKQGAAENLEGGFEGGTTTCTVEVGNGFRIENYYSKLETNDGVTYEYIDTIGDGKYDNCKVTVSNVNLEEVPIGWQKIEETSISAWCKNYVTNASEKIKVNKQQEKNIEVDEIDTEILINHEKILYDNEEGYTVKYRYMASSGNIRYDLCQVTVTLTPNSPYGIKFYEDYGWYRNGERELYKTFKEKRNSFLGNVNGHGEIYYNVEKIGDYIDGYIGEIKIENKPEYDSIPIGTEWSLQAVINPENTGDFEGDYSLSWNSDNPEIASINENGKIIGKSIGKATIRLEARGEKNDRTIVEEYPIYITKEENNSIYKVIYKYNADYTSCDVIISGNSSEYVIYSTNEGWELMNGQLPAIKKTYTRNKTEIVDLGNLGTQEINVNQIIVPITSITINGLEENETIQKGETTQLIAQITPTDASNQNVTWSTSNANIATVSENGLVTAIAKGKVTITATADGKTATHNIEVTTPTLTRIEIVSKPRKKEYKQGDPLDLSGLIVRAFYSNGEEPIITSYNTTPEDGVLLTTIGKIKIKVDYQGQTDEFEINVAPKLTGIKITNPDKTAYKKGEKLDLTGLKVEAVYSDGPNKPITDYEIDSDVEEGEILEDVGEKEITIRYEGMEKSFIITVTEETVNPTLNKIVIIKPSKTEYEKGEKLDLTELKVYAVYTDGEKIKIENYTIDAENGEELTEVGNKTITIKYGDLEPVSFVITVKEDKKEKPDGSGDGKQEGNGDGSQGGNGSQGTPGTTTSNKVSNIGKGTNANTAPKILPKTGIGETIRMYAIAFSIVMTIIGIIVICSYVRYRKTPRE